MRELVFLLEERSAEALLQKLLPRFLNPEIGFRTIAFDGKQDLEKQLTRRLLGYINPDARFLVLRDQDSAPDCKLVKRKLIELCRKSGKPKACLVRIACRELETIYIADLAATGAALGLADLGDRQKSRKFRNPDLLESPSKELGILTGGIYQKVGGSRKIGETLALDNDRSPTFRNLVGGIRRLEAELLALPGRR